LKPIVIDYKTYVPVKLPTPEHTITNTITPTKEGKIDSIKVGNITYIP
jgi:hypothetical protein